MPVFSAHVYVPRSDKEARRALNEGLTEEFKEERQLVDSAPDDVKEKIKSIIDRIFSKNNLEDRIPYPSIQISDTGTVNASMMSGVKQPILLIDKGLLEKVQSEDELAGVIGHELGHLLLHTQHMEAKHANKPEETAADNIALKLLSKADYNPNGLIFFFKGLAEESNVEDDGRADLGRIVLDPHPSEELRIRAMEAHIVLLKKEVKKEGNINEVFPEMTLLGVAFKEQVALIRYESPIARGLREVSYDTLSVVEKLTILKNLLEDIYPPTNKISAERVEEIAPYIQKLTVDFSDPEQAEAFNCLVDRAIGERYSAGADRVYPKNCGHGERIDKNLDAALKDVWRRGGKDPKYFARNERLNEVLGLFCEAQTQEEAEVHAAEIVDLCKKVCEYKSRQFKGFYPPLVSEVQASIKATGAWLPPYSKHVRWCREGQSENIKKVLYCMDLQQDPWVNKTLGDKVANDYAYQLEIANPHEHTYFYQIEKFERKEDGSITGALKPKAAYKAPPQIAEERPYKWLYLSPHTSLDALTDDHRAQGKKKKQYEEKIVDTTDWQRLQTDFSGFIAQYGHLINHQSSLVPVPSPFAERFFEELGAFLPLANEDFKWQVQDFFRHPRDEDIIRHPSTGRYNHFYNYPVHDDWPYLSIARPAYWRLEDPFIRFLLSPQSSAVIKEWHKLQFLHGALGFITPDPTKRLMDIFPIPLHSILAKYPRNNKTVADLAEEKSGYEDIIMALEAERLAYQFEDTLTLEEFVILNEFRLLTPKIYVSNIESFFDRLRHKTAQRQLNTDDCAELIKNYRYAVAYYFIHDAPLIRNAAIIKMKELLSKLPAQDKLECLKSLFKPEVFRPWGFGIGSMAVEKKYEGYIGDPEFRNWSIEEYTDALAAHLGEDDGSPDFMARLKPLIEEIAKNTVGEIQLQIFSRLATKINAQKEVAYLIRDTYNHCAVSGALSKHCEGIAVEVLISESSSDPILREKILHFLRNPLTKDSEKPLRKYLQEKYKHKFQKLSTIVINDQLHNLHKNFRAASLEMKTAYLETILFPLKSSIYKQQMIIQQLIREIFPLKEKVSRNIRDNNDYAQLIVQAYLEALVDSSERPLSAERRLLGTALFVANMSEEGGIEQRVGQKLNMILSRMGPAGGKLLQAIHSHPQTPADLKRDIASAKMMFAPPLRWELVELVEESGLLEDTDYPIINIGKLAGAGSFGFAVFNTRRDRTNKVVTKVVDTFLRRNAAQQAEDELRIMRRAAGQIVITHPELSPITSMVDEAQRSAKEETDMRLAEEANRQAESSYDFIRVLVDEYDFTHVVTRLLKTGKHFKRATVAEGEHFNELRNSPYKKAIAKAMIATQMTLRLAGSNTDLDRHGGNIKVQGSQINHFDFGAMNVTALTEEDKIITGRILAETILALAQGEDFATSFLASIQNAQVSDASRIYLNGLNKDFLALNDYIDVLDKDELSQVLAKCLIADTLDPLIRDSFKEKLGAMYEMVISRLQWKATEACIQVFVKEEAEYVEKIKKEFQTKVFILKVDHYIRFSHLEHLESKEEEDEVLQNEDYQQIMAALRELEQYGQTLKNEGWSKGDPVINLSKHLRHVVCSYNKEEAAPRIHALIQKGKLVLREDRRALDILAHIFIAITLVGFGFMVAQKIQTGTFFLNKTKREILLSELEEGIGDRFNL